MPDQPKYRSFRSALEVVIFVAACFVVSGLGQLFVRDSVGQWYENLTKPAFTPPGWLFGPVWTFLYFAMGLACWAVWRKRGSRKVAVPIALFAVQLCLNAAWTPLFFGLHNVGAAFADIIALWAAIVLTTVAFFKVSKLAGWLMIPYLAWVSFAAVLNFAIWRLNP
ncbi:MAG: TspO/MBR family protein [Planctomycetota bacterium]